MFFLTYGQTNYPLFRLFVSIFVFGNYRVSSVLKVEKLPLFVPSFAKKRKFFTLEFLSYVRFKIFSTSLS